MLDDDESEEKQPRTRRVLTINSTVGPCPVGSAGGGAGGGTGDSIEELKAEIMRLRKEASENASTNASTKQEFKRLSENHRILRVDYEKQKVEKEKAEEGSAQSSNDDKGFNGRVDALMYCITILRKSHLVKGGNKKKPIKICRQKVVRDLHEGLGKTPSAFLKESYGT